MPDSLDVTPYTAPAAALYVQALQRAKTTSDRDVMQEWWKLYNNSRLLAEVMACLDISEEGGRSYRIRRAEILSCDQQEDGGFLLVWQEDGEDETREARLGNLANPAYRLVKELADACIAQGLRANLTCGYEPNSRGWSTVVKGKNATPDYFRRVFRVQPIRSGDDQPQQPPAEQPAARPAAPPPEPASDSPPLERPLAAVPDTTDAPGPFGDLIDIIADDETLRDGDGSDDVDGSIKIADTAHSAAINNRFAQVWNDMSTEQKNGFLQLAKGEYAGMLTRTVRPVTLSDLGYFDEIMARIGIRSPHAA